MYPHRIRLRGPWGGALPGEPPRRVTVPCRLDDLGPASVPVVLTRKFGFPGRIDPHERVWLTIADVKGSARITLNERRLGEVVESAFEGDVTALLGPRNRLELQVCAASIGEVALEVRASAYLRNVRAFRMAGKLHVEGAVAGTCERPLELYVQVERRNALYRTIAAGESFQADLDEEGQAVRVELVYISTVWYVVELAGIS